MPHSTLEAGSRIFPFFPFGTWFPVSAALAFLLSTAGYDNCDLVGFGWWFVFSVGSHGNGFGMALGGCLCGFLRFWLMSNGNDWTEDCALLLHGRGILYGLAVGGFLEEVDADVRIHVRLSQPPTVSKI